MVFGQCMALAGTQIYSDPPHYCRGNGFALGAMIVGIVSVIMLMVYLSKKNATKRAVQFSEEANAHRALSLEEISDDHPDFFYYL